VHYAQVAVVRDRQVEEKKSKHERVAEFEKRGDLMMEAERVKQAGGGRNGGCYGSRLSISW
jgi:hypothetical protein